MGNADLLSNFQGHVAKFEKFLGFIEKAKKQAGKFAPKVVEKVVADNSEKMMECVNDIMPLIGDVEEHIQALQTKREETLGGRSDAQFALEELELRLAIEDISQKDFDAEAAAHKEKVDGIDAAVGDIDSELAEYQNALEAWNEVGNRSGILQPSEEEEEEVAEVEIDDVDAELEGFDDGEGEAHVESVSIQDDVSAVFEDMADIEVGETDDVIEVEVGDAETVPVDAVEEEVPAGERRAVLLYQEGTAEEQIHPFNGDQMQLGRGRDNDVQVKNDSKVSRYHCKLTRKDGNFYIEDNRSANGTLVNGELITERRLFGGEEVIIGETFFRFRILD